MKFEKKYISGRVTFIWVVAALVLAAIVGKASYTSTVQGKYWRDKGEVKVKDSIELPAARGNIYSADGQLVASSLPNYKLRVDFLSSVVRRDTFYIKENGDTVKKVIDEKSRLAHDTLWLENLDTISRGLARIVPIMSAKEYYDYLKKGLDKHSQYYDLTPGWLVNYIQYNEIKRLPLFNSKNKYLSGLMADPRNNRKKPFGSLARRTLGEMFPTGDSGKSGLEQAYDTLLKGHPGVMHRKKVLSKFLDIVDKEPVDGYDLVSTIDISMQDICESALREKLEELGADMGVVVLMEVQTGDVKAMVNLERGTDGNYYELRNYALAARLEPGSTFKTASIMVALDDGYITVKDLVDTGHGICPMYGAKMKDHNWNRGGYGVIDVPHVLMVSSNIGVSKLIDQHYHNQPGKFVEGLRRVGIGAPLGMPELFSGATDPQIRMPDDKRNYWSKTTLPWMSIGYETQIPPISTVTFYNAIANGGKMVRPRFVKGIERKGEMVEEFPVEVIKPSICKKSTLEDIQRILYRVVNDKEGLGKKAGNPYFHVSGKTGTAQVAGAGGYKGGANEHLVSFCGYYPSEEPKYTCIVAIRHNYYVSSGGGQAGPVFSKIAQRVYSKDVTTDLRRAKDSTAVFIPDVKTGDIDAAKQVLKELNVPANQVLLNDPVCDANTIPNVLGMGARDAIFALESRGLKVRIHGYGRVKAQSLPAGGKVVKGRTVSIDLN